MTGDYELKSDVFKPENINPVAVNALDVIAADFSKRRIGLLSLLVVLMK